MVTRHKGHQAGHTPTPQIRAWPAAHTDTLLEHRHRCSTGRGGRTRRRRRRRHLSTIIIIVPHQYHLLAARATLLLSMPHTLSDKRTTHIHNTAILAFLSFRDLLRSGHGHELLTCRCRDCRCSCRRTCSRRSRLRRRPRTRPRHACA